MSQNCNFDIPQEQCTIETCCLDRGYVNYLPSVPGNVIYLVIFAILMCAQTGLGIRYKTWGYMVGMSVGCFGEVVGYAGRIWMHYNLFTENPFLVYLVPLTISPAFLTASIYLLLGRVIQAYGNQFSLLPAGWYTALFISCDFVSLLLQAAGGALTSIADAGSDLQQTGINTMIAGLAFQVASLALFLLLAGYFFFNVHRGHATRNNRFYALTGSPRFRWAQYALAIATILIFVRCCFRVAELREGFDGSIANSEPLFMVFEGPMVFLAVALLTVFHPGLVFQGRWQEANFKVWQGKTKGAAMAGAGAGVGRPEWTELESQRPSEVELKGGR